MFGISLTAALPLLSLALTYALQGGKSPQAFAVGILPLVFLPASASFRENWFLHERALRPLLAYFLWAIVCLAAAPPMYLHLARLAVLASYLMVAAAATLWTDREKRIVLGAVLCIGLIESVFFLFLHMGSGSMTGHLAGNPIYTALTAASALLTIAVFAKGGRRSFLVPAAILLTVALVLTRSKSGLLGLVVAMALLAPRRRYVAGLAVLAGGLLLIGILDFNRILSYLKLDFARPEEFFGRLAIWRTALRASVDHPLVGWGLGNFEAGYLLHQLPVSTALRFDRSTIFAHNDLLQLAVESGWPGAALGVWALAAFARSVKSHFHDPIARWAAAVVALYATAGCFNFTFYLPANGFMAAAAFGIGTGGAAVRTTQPAPRWSRAWIGVPIFLLLFATLNGVADTLRLRGRPDAGARVLPIRADLWYDAALATLNSRTPKAQAELALGYLDRSLKWNSQDAFAWDRLGMVKMAMSSDDAPAAFSRAIDLAPMHTPFWIDAGFERLRSGDDAGAEQRFTRASELEPNAPLPWFALAVAAQERGERSKAQDFLEKAVAVRKQFISTVAPSGYAAYLFGMSEEQMRKAISTGRPGGWSKRA